MLISNLLNMRIVFVLLMLVSISAGAQWKDYKIGPKGDTLNRVDMKGKKQGPWVIHLDEMRGERGYEEEGYFENDAKEGTWRRFSLEGDLIAIENYKKGNLDGKNTYFTYVGDLEHEESWRAPNPDSPYDTVAIYDINDPNKVIRYEVIKTEGKSYKHGTWRFYDPSTGTIVKTEKWFMDKPAANATAGSNSDDDLRPLDISDGQAAADTAAKKTIPKPKEILDFEKKNSGKKKVKVRDGRTGGYLPKP